MAAIPDLDFVLSLVPEEKRQTLDQRIEFRHLTKIADHILDWDGPVADELTLTNIERHDIKEGNTDPRQRRRAALNRWQEKFGSQATYRNLIVALYNAQKMEYVEVVCRQLGATFPPATPTTTTSRTLLVGGAQPGPSEPEGSGRLSFSDCLSPSQLTDWLKQELESIGLTLEESQRQSLLDEDINGKAFRELTDEELKVLGFKLGARKNMRGIITSIAESMAMTDNVSPSSTAAYVRDPTLTAQALDEALESLVLWYTFGMKLGLPTHELDIIQKDYQGVKNQKVALYNLWLERDTAASWNKVCGALAQEGKKVLAAHLKATRVARKPVAIKQTSEGSKVTEAGLLECLRGCSDSEVRAVGVALGITNTTLDGLAGGQSLAEVVARDGVGNSDEISWRDLKSTLEEAGESEAVQRIEINRNNIEKLSKHTSGNET